MLSHFYLICSIVDLLFGAVPIIYEEQRGWNILQGSLPFLAVLLGTLFAAAINAIYSQFVFAPNVDKHGGKVPPEKRLPPMSTFCVFVVRR
jgi:DHA1 family multidrug resistance protein-like MFS transporter